MPSALVTPPTPGRAAQLVEMLRLQPHPEGGFYRETYRSARRVKQGRRERCAVTTIYYLLCTGQASRWHVVQSDELWHVYEGDGLELLVFHPATTRLDRVRLHTASADAEPVHVVPAGSWQAVRPLGEYALAGCTVAPGFEFVDFSFVADDSGHEPAFEGPLAAFRDLL